MSLTRLVEESLEKYGEYVALAFEGRQYTNVEQHRTAGRVANALRRLGVEPGDRVMVMLPELSRGAAELRRNSEGGRRDRPGDLPARRRGGRAHPRRLRGEGRHHLERHALEGRRADRRHAARFATCCSWTAAATAAPARSPGRSRGSPSRSRPGSAAPTTSRSSSTRRGPPGCPRAWRSRMTTSSPMRARRPRSPSSTGRTGASRSCRCRIPTASR